MTAACVNLPPAKCGCALMIKPVLLVDIGNSRVKWGWGDAVGIRAGTPFATADLATALAVHWRGLPPPAQVLVSNVGGAAAAATLQAWTQPHWQLTPVFARSVAAGFGVVNGYAAPETLGVDRWLALVAARGLHTGPVCVADCGTALTFDALDGQGRHLGGWIAPGLGLMRQALARGTAALPDITSTAVTGLADNTRAGIAGGTLQAAAGLIEGGMRRVAEHSNAAPALLLTGGDAAAIAAVLAMPSVTQADLVLQGLQIIAQTPP